MCLQSPAQFAGPGFTLALIPHSCLIFPANKTLACAPAQVVLLKSPGERQQTAGLMPEITVVERCRRCHLLSKWWQALKLEVQFGSGLGMAQSV